MKVGDLVRSKYTYECDKLGEFYPVGFIVGHHETRDMRRLVQWIFPIFESEGFIPIWSLEILSEEELVNETG